MASIYLLFCVAIWILFFKGILLASAKQLTVSGWNVSRFPQSPHELFHDPVLGRISCPALTQFNDRHKKSIGIILHSVVDQGSIWKLRLRPGIYFWSGKEVDGEDLAGFLSQNLLNIVRWKTGRQSLEFEFDTQVDGLQVSVLFKSKPKFGPYILNGWPFHRKTSNKQFATTFECSGRFWPAPTRVASSKAVELKRTPNYKGKTSSIVLTNDLKVANIQILWPSDFSNSPKYYSYSKSKKCMPILLPAFSGLFWSSRSGVSQAQRQAIADSFEFEDWVELSGLGLNTYVKGPRKMLGPKKPGQKSVTAFLGALTGRAGLESLLKTQGVSYAISSPPHKPSLDLIWRTFKADGLGIDGGSQIEGYIADFSQIDGPTRTGRRAKSDRAWGAASPVGGLMRQAICIRTEGLGRKPLAANDADWFRYLIP